MQTQTNEAGSIAKIVYPRGLLNFDYVRHQPYVGLVAIKIRFDHPLETPGEISEYDYEKYRDRPPSVDVGHTCR